MRRTPLVRSLTALFAAALVGGALAGCTGLPFGGGCTPAIPSGDASSTVAATGPLGSKPAIEFPTPLIVDGPQRSVIHPGDGAVIGEYATVAVELTVLNASTGAVLEASRYSGFDQSLLYTAGESQGAFGDSLLCATVGSRYVLIAPAETFVNDYDPTIEFSGDNLVVVVDVLNTWIGKADGINQLPADGMPAVVTAVEGTPGVSVSTQELPTSVRSATIKAGGGEAIAEGDIAIIHVRTWHWKADGSVKLGALDSWAGRAPYRALIDTTTTDTTLPTAVYQAIVGTTVGSQLLIVVPGQDGATIYVIDALGIDRDE